ncbi:MAG: response regulator [Gemmatimonadota bacterium]
MAPEKEKVNILLVDDQPGKLLAYEAMLAPLGETLIRANSGREALEELLRTDITVVLMDVSMPELDGFELAEIIREHPRYRKTAIIFVSAVHLSDLDRLKAYASGAVDYLSVPVIPEILRAKVSVFVELYRKTREWERLNEELERRVRERTAELEASMVTQVDLSERLRQADHRKDEFLASLAHELRNPLAPIRNAIEILNKKPAADPESVWCREVLNRQSAQLIRLVDDLLDVSRITHGKIKLKPVRLELAEVLEQAIEASQPLIDAHRHTLAVTLGDDPVPVDGDPARLIQVFGNLLNNAAKYQEDHGRIELDMRLKGDTAIVTVRDRGVGIPPELLSQIFELFAQGERAPDRAAGGLGVGLSLVKSLVEMHGGRVVARSDGPGHGAEFSVHLPIAVAAPAEIEGPARAGGPAQRSSRRILLVDDNHDAADSLAMILRLSGHDVSVAHDGPRALEIASAEQPAFVLLDIGLPGMDGYEVCRRLRDLGLTEARIIAMTGYGQDRDRQRSQDAGFDLHTVKPVEIHGLMSILAEG